MASSAFKASIKIRGINPFIEVSAARAAAVKPGWRKPLPVLVRINGKPSEPHRINMMPAGDGGFYLYLNNVIRTEADVVVGDRVSVEIEFDPGYRNGPQHPMPRWFQAALDAHPDARRNWTKLSPSRKKEVLRYFAQLKSPEARARNLARALPMLAGETGRFMGRTWREGS